MTLARFPGGSAKEPSRDQCFAAPVAELKAGAESTCKRMDHTTLSRETHAHVRAHGCGCGCGVAQITRVLHRLWVSW